MFLLKGLELMLSIWFAEIGDQALLSFRIRAKDTTKMKAYPFMAMIAPNPLDFLIPSLVLCVSLIGLSVTLHQIRTLRASQSHFQISSKTKQNQGFFRPVTL
jgi:hypothetical protein